MEYEGIGGTNEYPDGCIFYGSWFATGENMLSVEWRVELKHAEMSLAKAVACIIYMPSVSTHCSGMTVDEERI